MELSLKQKSISKRRTLTTYIFFVTIIFLILGTFFMACSPYLTQQRTKDLLVADSYKNIEILGREPFSCYNSKYFEREPKQYWTKTGFLAEKENQGVLKEIHGTVCCDIWGKCKIFVDKQEDKIVV